MQSMLFHEAVRKRRIRGGKGHANKGAMLHTNSHTEAQRRKDIFQDG